MVLCKWVSLFSFLIKFQSCKLVKTKNTKKFSIMCLFKSILSRNLYNTVNWTERLQLFSHTRHNDPGILSVWVWLPLLSCFLFLFVFSMFGQVSIQLILEVAKACCFNQFSFTFIIYLDILLSCRLATRNSESQKVVLRLHLTQGGMS